MNNGYPNQMPNGQMPGGQMPGGQMPGGQMPNGQMPQGQIPQGQMQPGMYGPMPNGQMPNGQMPNGQMMYQQQMMYQRPPKKPMSKKTIAIILGAVGGVFLLLIIGIVAIILLAGRLDETSSESVAEHYLEYLQKEDFDKAYKLAYIPQNSKFYNAKDYKNTIQKTSVYTNVMSNNKGKIVVTKTYEAGSEATYTYTIGGQSSYTQILTLKKDSSNNKWRVSCSDTYHSSVSLSVPKGAEVTFDGKKLTNPKTNTYSALDSYTIEYVAKVDKEVVVKTAFGTYKEKLSTSSKSYFYDFVKVTPGKEVTDFIETAWNELVKGATSNDTAALDKYMDSNSIKKDSVYNSIKSNLFYKSSLYECTNFKLSNVKISSSYNSTIVDSDKIKVYFTGTLTYDYKYLDLWSGHKKGDLDPKTTEKTYAYVTLSVNNGTYKIYDYYYSVFSRY